MASADFDQSYQPINGSYPSGTGTSYTVQTGDTLYQIAARVWGDASLWYLIADANGLNAGIALSAGQVLSIPNKVTNVHNSSSTFKPYDAGAAMGDTSPTLPTAPPPPPPPSPKKKKGGFFKRLVSAIVAALVAIYAPVLLPMISGYGALTIAAAAAIGNAAGQVTANALGVQSGFSWTSLATATLSAGITNGLGDVARNTFGVTSEFGNLALNSAVNNVVYQGVANLTGQQSGFSWSSVAVSAIAAPLAKGLTGAGGLNIGNPVGVAAITSLVSAATRVAIVGGKLDWQAVAVDTLSAMAVQGIGPRTSNGASGSAEDGGNKQPNEIQRLEQQKAESGPPSSGSLLESIQQTVPGYEDAAYDNEDGWQFQTTGDNGSPSPRALMIEAKRDGSGERVWLDYGNDIGTGSATGSGAIWKNEDQRKAWMDILSQDPTMTPEKFAHAQDMSLLADAAYLNRGAIPDHFERITNFGQGDLAGFTQSDFENEEIGFSASLFRDTRNGSYTLSYRGTDNGPDWGNGNVQAFSPSAPQYEKGIELAKRLQFALGDQFTDITGHSLGGGLGAAASILTGIRATTFNAAGLNPETVTSRGGTWSVERAQSLITNYRVQDEVLTSMQERGSFGSVPLSVLTPFIGPSAFALNGAAALLPDAAGRQITIRAFDQNNQSMSLIERNNVFQMRPVDLHGMDYVMRGMLVNHSKEP
ncbi:MAG: LysM peptidoglycan-binding domain-containing protein [Rhodocyclaceae bacterium]|nr:LysM peptidoglycan-binding domain-containing protein [Rhodocyclaceae bacterium]